MMEGWKRVEWNPFGLLEPKSPKRVVRVAAAHFEVAPGSFTNSCVRQYLALDLSADKRVFHERTR